MAGLMARRCAFFEQPGLLRTGPSRAYEIPWSDDSDARVFAQTQQILCRG